MNTKLVALPKMGIFRLEIVLSLAAIAVPFVLAGPQWLVGTVVNTILFLAAMKVEKKNWWPIAVLPSMAAAARGLIFGPMTWFLIYFMPMIWLGNYILMYLFDRVKGWRGICAVSLVKVLILFGTANVYLKLGWVPKMFLTSMGTIQLMTAIAGGIIASGFMRTLLAGRGESSQK